MIRMLASQWVWFGCGIGLLVGCAASEKISQSDAGGAAATAGTGGTGETGGTGGTAPAGEKGGAGMGGSVTGGTAGTTGGTGGTGGAGTGGSATGGTAGATGGQGGAGGSAPTPSSIGVFRSGSWILDTAHTHQYVASDLSFAYGAAGDTPLTGHFGGSASSWIGVARKDAAGSLGFYLDSNGDHLYQASDLEHHYGLPTDRAVAGDWSGNGQTRIGVFRGGTWILDLNGTGILDAGDPACTFGASTDIAVVGDWNGDGKSKIGTFRNGTWFLDSNGSCAYEASDLTFNFGTAGDQPLVGDWNGDGKSDVAVARANSGYGLTWTLDSNGSYGYDSADESFTFGLSTDIVVAGAW